MLGSCVVSTLGIYLLDINLDALIVYANGIFIMIYLLCMLAGCRLLRGRYRLLAVVGAHSLSAAAGDGRLGKPVRAGDAGGAVAVFTQAQAGDGKRVGLQRKRPGRIC